MTQSPSSTVRARVVIDPRFSYLRLHRSTKPRDSGFGKDGEFVAKRYPLAEIKEHAARGGNLGVRTGKQSSCFVLDVDPRNGGDRTLADFVDRFGPLPATYTVRSGGGGHHYYFRLPDFEVRSGTNALGPGLDIKGEQSYVVAPGSIHPKSQQPYEIESDAGIASAPPWLIDRLRSRAERVPRRDTSSIEGMFAPPPKVTDHRACCEMVARNAVAAIEARLRELAALLPGQKLRIDGDERGWDVGAFMLAARLVEIAYWPYSTVTLEEVRRSFFEHAPTGEPGFDPDHKWESALDDVTQKQGTWRFGERHRLNDHVVALPKRTVADSKTADGADLSSPYTEFTDAGVARRIAHDLALQQRGVVYAYGLGWYRWDETRWRPTDAGGIKGLVLSFAESWVEQLVNEGASEWDIAWAQKMLGEAKAARIVRTMEALERVDASQFDANPDLLNCPNGVVDLRTGELMPHDPQLWMTKVTAVPYIPGARSKLWERIKTALPLELLTYVMRRLGQATTGHTPTDDKNVFNIGVGGNGKSTFLDPIRAALGDYAATVPQKLLLANPSEHPTELMTLRGVRLAVLEELPEQGHLNTQRLKTISGTETIKARGMRQDFIEFRTTHALFVNTNHAPNITETDPGTWRRVLCVPFRRRFRAEDGSVDETIRQKTRAASVLRAVLADLIAAAQPWYADGRVMPPAPQEVLDATQAWRADCDDLIAYFEERLIADPDAAVRSSELLDDYNLFLESRRQHAWSDKLLSARLTSHEGLPVSFKKRQRSRHYVDRNGRPIKTRQPVTVYRGVRFR